MTDISTEGVAIPAFDLSTKSPPEEDDGRMYYHDGSNPINLVGGGSTSFSGLYIWNFTEGLWGAFPESNDKLGGYTADDFLFLSELAVADGVASLDSNGEIPDSQIPSVAISNTSVVADQTERLALSAETGDVAIQDDVSKSYILKGTDPSLDSEWKVLKSPTDAVDSVFGRTGTVTAEYADYDHADLGAISPDDHHVRYADTEAVSAVNAETTLTVNISGDADTLDGEHASAFADAGHTHDGRYYTETEVDSNFNNYTFSESYLDLTNRSHGNEDHDVTFLDDTDVKSVSTASGYEITINGDTYQFNN